MLSVIIAFYMYLYSMYTYSLTYLYALLLLLLLVCVQFGPSYWLWLWKRLQVMNVNTSLCGKMLALCQHSSAPASVNAGLTSGTVSFWWRKYDILFLSNAGHHRLLFALFVTFLISKGQCPLKTPWGSRKRTSHGVKIASLRQHTNKTTWHLHILLYIQYIIFILKHTTHVQ